MASTGSTSWQPVNDFLARPTSPANSDRVCIVPDGQTKFGYKNAYKTVYNVENVFVIRDIRGTVPQPDPQREQDGVNLRYLRTNYNGNPTLDGTEAELTGVTLNGVKYKVPSGGSDNALIKPSGNPTEDSVVKVSPTGTTSYAPIKKRYLHAISFGWNDSVDNGIKSSKIYVSFASDKASFSSLSALRSYLSFLPIGGDGLCASGKLWNTQTNSFYFVQSIDYRYITGMNSEGQDYLLEYENLSKSGFSFSDRTNEI